jgi:asparagine synthase (glutamine-hydrolysing)
MCNEDESIWIVFNGEIYNFREWAKWLEKRGHIFKSRTDTEVILHLYEEKGVEFLKCLNGMFAFALWDDKKRQLLLARDRMGVKPLVYAENGGQIIFASEMKSILKHPSITREIDPIALKLYFSFNFIPAPWTIYKGIRKLPHSQYLIFNSNGLKLERFWNPLETKWANLNEEEASEELRSLVMDATGIRLISDVPLGAFLSGGIDSGIVVAAMARHMEKPVKTYFIKYGNDPLFDETKYARAVAEMYGTDHHEIEVTPRMTLEILPEVISFFDEPFADSSALPTHVVSHMTRKHVTVALSGDGGDEMFAGYRRYLGEVFIDYYLLLPAGIRKKIIQPLISSLPESKNHQILEYLRRIKIFVRGAEEDSAKRHYSWLAYFPDSDREQLLMDHGHEEDENHGEKLIERLYGLYPGSDSINRMLFADQQNLLIYDMLNKVDWMSMKNSLEVRSPFLDYRINELSMRIPGNLKIKGSKLKYILKKAFKEWLPKELLKRPKQGFEIPIGGWFRESESFRKLFWDTVSSRPLKHQGLFRESKIRTLYEEHLQNKRDNSHKLWAIMVFQNWYWGQHGPHSS